MSDQNLPATKKDIQLLIEAMTIGMTELKTELKGDINELRDDMNKLESNMNEKFRDSNGHTKILIEDAFYDLKSSRNDQLSVHQNRLDRYSGSLKKIEKRLSRIEDKVLT